MRTFVRERLTTVHSCSSFINVGHRWWGSFIDLRMRRLSALLGGIENRSRRRTRRKLACLRARLKRRHHRRPIQPESYGCLLTNASHSHVQRTDWNWQRTTNICTGATTKKVGVASHVVTVSVEEFESLKIELEEAQWNISQKQNELAHEKQRAIQHQQQLHDQLTTAIERKEQAIECQREIQNSLD